MTTNLTPPDPARFNLTSFAELLPRRAPIVGEDHGSFEGFRTGMMQSLLPMTPYEGVIAENIIAIEWELLQHRLMRDMGLRQHIHKAIMAAVIYRQEYLSETELNKSWKAHLAAGGSKNDWKPPHSFDRNAAQAKGNDLAKRAISKDPSAQERAYAEITALGIEPVAIMGEAYLSSDWSIVGHDQKLRELERRRREVKRDFDLLQRARPVEAEVIEG